MIDASEAAARGMIVPNSSDAPRIFEVLTRAFAADPASRWLFPEEAQYLRHFPAFARALSGKAIPLGTALANLDHSGVCLWLPPDVEPDEQALAALIEHGVRADKQSVMAEVIEQMVRFHPKEPHWYLPFIGVEPARQGQGVGAALLQVSLTVCDTAQLPAYLESTNPRNRPLYERCGFEAVGEISVEDCPPIVPMLWKPKTRATPT